MKSQIPVRTWADWDDAVPGFVEIDLVGREGGNSRGEFCFTLTLTLTLTDIATGWTVNRSVRNKAQKWVFEALEHVVDVFSFPILGIDSDNGSEFINEQLLRWCIEQKVTFTHSRPGNKNVGYVDGDMDVVTAECEPERIQRLPCALDGTLHRLHPAGADPLHDDPQAVRLVRRLVQVLGRGGHYGLASMAGQLRPKPSLRRSRRHQPISVGR